jgi:nucleotide-binding universal stress UspA family protein
MFNNILVPTDGSDLAAKAVEQVLLFAKEIGGKITTVTVTEPFPSHLLVEPNQFGDPPIEYKKHAEAYAEKVLDTVSAAAKSAGVVCETLHVEHAQVFQAIIDAARGEAVRFDWLWPHTGVGVSRRSFSAARPSKCLRIRRSRYSCIVDGFWGATFFVAVMKAIGRQTVNLEEV